MRRIGPELALLLAVLLAVFTAATPVAAVAGPPAAGAGIPPLGQTLPAAHARAARLWPRVADDEFDGRGIARSLENRSLRSVRLPGRSVPRADTLAGAPRGDSFDPREAVYSAFLAGRDTVRFTYGHIAEAYGGIPRLILGSPGARRGSFPLAPLAHWNVGAMWYTGDYLIFGCTFEPEGSVRYQQIALWHLPTGRWYTSPREERLYHRGFKLGDMLEDWRSARASSDGGSVALAGARSALVLEPKTGSWALVDGTGKGIPPPPRRVARRLAPATAAMHARLRAPLLAAFREWNRGVDSVRILEVMREPCVAHRGAAAILVQGTAPPPTLNAADSPDIQATMNSELFGVFLADSALGSIESRVDMFPTSRFGDYVLYFDLEAPDDGMTVYGQGDSYGDEETKRTYRCGN